MICCCSMSKARVRLMQQLRITRYHIRISIIIKDRYINQKCPLLGKIQRPNKQASQQVYFIIRSMPIKTKARVLCYATYLPRQSDAISPCVFFTAAQQRPCAQYPDQSLEGKRSHDHEFSCKHVILKARFVLLLLES